MRTAQKMKFSSKDFFSKCDKIRRFLRIWSYLLKKSLMGNLIFCAVTDSIYRSSFLGLFYKVSVLNSLSANPSKRSNTNKQFVCNNRRIVWVCLTILWGWCWKGYHCGKFLRSTPIMKFLFTKVTGC